MNRRNTKKIVIAPKIPVIPVKQESELVVTPETGINGTNLGQNEGSEERLVRRLKGLHVPRQFERSPQFDYTKDNFVLSLNNTENLSLVVFKDGSVGFKRNGVLLDSDLLHIGNSAVVEIGNEIRKIKGIKFIVTGYDE